MSRKGFSMKSLQRSQRRRQRGMTLIEIVVVITILGLLMGAIVVAVIPTLDKAKQDKARLDIGALLQGLDLCKARNGKYPDTGTGLKELVDKQCIKELQKDPWGNDYVYMNEGGKPVIITYGNDGSPGGSGLDEDISSKNPSANK